MPKKIFDFAISRIFPIFTSSENLNEINSLCEKIFDLAFQGAATPQSPAPPFGL